MSKFVKRSPLSPSCVKERQLAHARAFDSYGVHQPCVLCAVLHAVNELGHESGIPGQGNDEGSASVEDLSMGTAVDELGSGSRVHRRA